MCQKLLPSGLQEAIERRTGFRIRSIGPASGGSISEAQLIQASNGDTFFLKYHESAPEGLYAAEAEGLKTLGSIVAVRVPKVHSFDERRDHATPAYILLEYLPRGDTGTRAQEQLGRSLAKLHSTRGIYFGYGSDNFIGLSPQINYPMLQADESSFADFFLTYRILPQRAAAEKIGWFTDDFADLLCRAESRMYTLLSENNELPSLLHGDLWSGNVWWSTSGPALIDPAVYYGSREADLAMMELFGTPSKIFWRAYEEVLPLADGYAERRDILNLYHLFNHANLFGGAYISQVRSCLTQLAH